MYSFAYTRGIWPFKTILKNVKHHMHEPELDQMVIFFSSGEKAVIRKWKDCEAHLGADHFEKASAFVKKLGNPTLVK